MDGVGDQMIRAAGGVLWRSSASATVEVALVHRPRYDDWSLPKGKLRRGEHPLVAACREVAEETGVRATAGKRLEVEHYDTDRGPKAVEYWAMHGPDGSFTPTAEVDRLAWMSLADARWRLSYRRDSYAIDALEARADGALATSAVLLVRNARAAPLRRWDGTEGDRPHLLATLAEEARLDVMEYPAVKGSVWALFFSGGKLAAADYYPALTSLRPLYDRHGGTIVAGQMTPVSLSATAAGGTHRPGRPRQGMKGSTGDGNLSTQ